MSDNKKAIDSLLRGISYLIKNAIDNAPNDKLYVGLIKEVHENNTYDLLISDNLYTNIPSMFKGLRVNDTVKVMSPQNQMNNIFIVGKLDMDISGGGGSTGSVDWNDILNKPNNLVQDSNYVHTDNNFTTTEKNKLSSVQNGAEVNVQSDWNIEDETNDAYIKNKPLNLSDFSNDVGFITNTVNNLTNYYTKSLTYTKEEVNGLISGIITLNILVVESLPTSNISTKTIYLLPKSNAENNDIYDEYINTDGTSNGWELIGSTKVDLSNYYTISQVDNLLLNKVDKVNGKQLSTNDFTDEYKTNVDNNTSSRHTHNNKSVLDGIASSDITNWNNKLNANGDGSNLTATFTQSSTLANILSGETLKVIFGKISKAINDIISHIGNKSNPHSVTKSQVGLGNVGNFKAVSTVVNQGLSTTEQSNARSNIGAGTSNFSGNYNDLTNKPTIPTVNNGTITITQNGTTKGSFTMNQSENATVALTDNNTTYGVATSSTLGLVKSGTDITVDSSGNVSVNDDSHNHTKFQRESLIGKTISLNDLTLFDGTSDIKYYICETDGGGSNITGRPNDNAKTAFLLNVELIRWASTSDYITKQTYIRGVGKIIYVRYCTSGSWSSWSQIYTSANPQTSISGNAGTATKATQDSSGQQINKTYIKSLSVSGSTITYTKGDGTTGQISLPQTTIIWNDL